MKWVVFFAGAACFCTLAARPADAANTVTVHIFDFDFSTNPSGGALIDPTIDVGDTIHWVWDSSFFSHSTTSVAGILESWDSGLRASSPPTSFDHTFTHLGSFEYYCRLHGSDLGGGKASGMSGVIHVVPEPASIALLVTGLAVLLIAGVRRRFA